MQPWKTLSRKTILNHSKYLAVEEHVVELPDGRVISNWPWVILPDYVNVVAVTPEGQFLVFRQVKYAVPGTTLAVVGGYLEPDEEPLAAAQRELLEETGYQSDHWSSLGRFQVGANRGLSEAHFFLAQEARQVAEADADDLEEQQLLLFDRSQVEDALAAGEFKVLAWASILAFALQFLDKQSLEG